MHSFLPETCTVYGYHRDPKKIFQEKFMTQYSRRMVIVHWLTLALLIAAWFLGDAVNEARKEDGATLLGYAVHGLVGGAVLLFTLARFYFRNQDGVPPPLGDTLLDKVAKGIHYALYAALILVPLRSEERRVGKECRS